MRLDQESLSRSAPALVILCTRPRLAPAKSRALPDAGAQATFDLNQALLACAIEDAECWNGPVALALALASDLSWAGSVARRDWSIVGQAGGNAGERINTVDHLLRRHGARTLVFIGTDAPAHTEADYALARAALESADVAMTTSTRGGVTLMAARRPWPDLATLAWNTNRLVAELAYHCEREGLRVGKLPRRHQVQGLADCARIATELASDARPKRQALVAVAQRLLEQ
ncbi:MAG TPA: DUF2064 domain-containing protein [Steroidobacteraceae bacterium]|nr:DUF2064 domain-containing protein [Steroidobacteraceae bacterium]